MVKLSNAQSSMLLFKKNQLLLEFGLDLIYMQLGLLRSDQEVLNGGSSIQMGKQWSTLRVLSICRAVDIAHHLWVYQVLSRKDTQKVACHKYDWKNLYIMLSHIFRKWNPGSSSINDYGTPVKFYIWLLYAYIYLSDKYLSVLWYAVNIMWKRDIDLKLSFVIYQETCFL